MRFDSALIRGGARGGGEADAEGVMATQKSHNKSYLEKCGSRNLRSIVHSCVAVVGTRLLQVGGCCRSSTW